MEENKKINVIATRVMYSTGKTVLEVICGFVLFLFVFIGLGFPAAYIWDVDGCLPQIIGGIIGLLLSIIYAIIKIVKLNKNHNAPDNILAIREDGKLIIYEENGDKIYIDLDDISYVTAKNAKTTIVTPYFYSQEEYNYGEVCIYSDYGKDVVKDVHNPEDACFRLTRILEGEQYDD